MSMLSDWLEQHGLAKHADLFAANDIDLDILGDLTDADLEKLGLSLGDRRRVLKAATATKAQQRDDVAIVQAEMREAERRQLTVMFTDLVGSTSLSTRYDPEEMQGIIADYQKAVHDEIVRFGGYVAKPLGDGLLIYFGWPQAHEDDPGRALRSALAAITAVKQLTTPRGESIGIRIGVATGEVLVGDFAHTSVAEAGAVVGETPNLAARLQALARENTVSVAEETRSLVGGEFAFADQGDQEIRGYNEPVRVWHLEGEVTSESRFDAIHGTRLGPLVGRDHEMGYLMDRWQQASEGECQLVLISGEAGIGKSRLVAEVVRRLADERRISFQASALHTNTALFPVLRQLEKIAGFSSEDSAAEKYGKLAAMLPSGEPLQNIALVYLADLMSLEAPDEDRTEAAKHASDAQREAALQRLIGAIATMATGGPLLIVIEDAQWLDATTQEFIGRLLVHLHDCHAMLLVTYRPEFEPPWAQHGNVGLLSLSRFGRRHAMEIINALLTSDQNLSTEVAEAIVARSDGVPLFVEELAVSVLSAGGADDSRDVRIPATLRDTLSERLDKLGSAKEVAQVAAAIGREFTSDVVAASLTRSETGLAKDLDRLLQIGVVFRSAGSDHRFVFKHALLQDAAYESMPKSKRREVHACIADALAALHPSVGETEPEVLAKHYQRAGDTKNAAGHWRAAGRNALRSSAYREAIGAFTRSLELDAGDTGSVEQRIDLNRSIATAYFAVADIGAVKRHLTVAAEEAERIDDRVRMAEIAIQQCHVLNIFGGHVSEAAEAGERALASASEHGDQQLASGARFALGQMCWVAGDCARGIELFSANLPDSLPDPDQVRDIGTAGSLMIDSVASLGACYGHRGEFDHAFAFFDQARALLDTIEPTAFDLMVVDSHPSRALLQQGDGAGAMPLLERNRQRCADAGLRFSLPLQTGFLGYAHVLVGDIDTGLSLLQEALEDCPAVYFEALMRVLNAQSLLNAGRDEALEAAEGALQLARNIGYRAQEVEALRLTAEALGPDDATEADSRATQSLGLARSLGLRPDEAHALRVLAKVHATTGRNEQSDQYRTAARSLYTELKMDHWLDKVPA